MTFARVDAEKAVWPIAIQCEALGVSRSGYYAWRGRPEAARTKTDAELVVEIKVAHKAAEGLTAAPAFIESCAPMADVLERSASNA